LKSVQAESTEFHQFCKPGQGSVLILLLRSPAVVQLLDLFSCSVRAIFRMDLFIFCDWRCCCPGSDLVLRICRTIAPLVFPVRSRVLRSVLAADPFCFFFSVRSVPPTVIFASTISFLDFVSRSDPKKGAPFWDRVLCANFSFRSPRDPVSIRVSLPPKIFPAVQLFWFSCHAFPISALAKIPVTRGALPVFR
jgi:hypothetical protein